ncbi:hypothetical protein ACHAWF_015546 [Thalassiosira exigua]
MSKRLILTASFGRRPSPFILAFPIALVRRRARIFSSSRSHSCADTKLTMTATTSEPTRLPPVIKGDADYRAYRPLLLDNGLTVLLATDAQSKHLAAAVSVTAGASSDPRSLPGLAHFCEHMCFLGSKAYPGENEYKQYLAQHGGKSNAATSMSHTTYQFDVLAEHGEKALDIFSNFFISPLFSKSGTQREVNAVDSENSKNHVSDLRRRLQVLKSLADENHHYSKFSTGNRITLPACASADDSDDPAGKANSEPGAKSMGEHPLHDILKDIGNGTYDDSDKAEFVRAALLAFHEKHYTPANMTAVVIGPQSLDELESWAVPRLSQISDRSQHKHDKDQEGEEDDDGSKSDSSDKWEAMQRAAAQLIDEAANDAPPVSIQAAETVEHRSAFRPELQGGKWPVVVTTKPLSSVRKLVLHFPLPPTWNVPDRSPTSLLSHLFGHEGPGSPFARLQDAGWISSLSAGNRVTGPDQALFQISVTLTAEGEEHWKDVAKVIFDYGKLIRRFAEDSTAVNDNTANDDTCENGGSELRRIWDEVAALDQMRFHQTSPGAVYSFASSVAQSISKYGTETCLSAGSLLNENGTTIPLAEVREFSRKIIPENCFIERCSDGAWEEMESIYKECESRSSEEVSVEKKYNFGKHTERWYGVDFYVSPVGEDAIKNWEQEIGIPLHLPIPNRYIPRSLELSDELPDNAKQPGLEKPIEPPKLIINEPNVRLWHKLDNRYALPKASVTILLRTATAENTKQQPEGTTKPHWSFDANTSMKSRFLTHIFADALAQETYDAYLAGLGWSLSNSSSGFTLTCSGYSDRLSNLALKLLADFCSVGDTGDKASFLKGHYFATVKDKIERGLKSYFESRRADSLALYYRNLLLSSQGQGIEKNLEIAKAMTLADIAKQHQRIWADKNMMVEIYYSGNVSQKEAKDFSKKSIAILERAQSHVTQDAAHTINSTLVPGPFERRLPPGDDLELHFSSKNPKEENGAVIFTYQSQVPGFKGKVLSSEESLRQSAAIRLLCKIIREPLFDELRTKQQLGYIVSSYYDVNYSSHQTDFDSQSILNTLSGAIPQSVTSIDSLVVYVLSRKETPIEVANRINDFLSNFRSRLEEMTDDTVSDYADSLAKALTKPVKKLGDEASNHMSKIRRYAPETLSKGYKADDLPWDNPEILAQAIRDMDRGTLLRLYDAMVLSKETRSRIVTFVYGSTYPLELRAGKPFSNWAGGKSSILSLDGLMTVRRSLIPFDPQRRYCKDKGSLWRAVGRHKNKIGMAAAAALALGVWGTLSLKSRGDEKKRS